MKRIILSLIILLTALFTNASDKKEFTFSKIPSELNIHIKTESYKGGFEQNTSFLQSLANTEMTKLKIKYDEIGQTSDAYKDEVCVLLSKFINESTEYLSYNLKYSEYEMEDLMKSKKEEIYLLDKNFYDEFGYDCRTYWNK